MTETANRLTVGVKKLGRLPGAIAVWLQALDYTSFANLLSQYSVRRPWSRKSLAPTTACKRRGPVAWSRDVAAP